MGKTLGLAVYFFASSFLVLDLIIFLVFFSNKLNLY